MGDTVALILAAGKGTRMKSEIPKVLHKAAGKAMIEHVITACEEAGVKRIYAVVGHKSEDIINTVGDNIGYIIQDQQLGTGHALIISSEYLPKDKSSVIVLVGDAPLIDGKTIEDMIKIHEDNDLSATVLTSRLSDPTGYGRIVKDADGNLLKIVEHKDATEEEKKIDEVNSGMYCFKSEDLLSSLKELDNKNSQGEYYLTDIIEIMNRKGLKTGSSITSANIIKAVNSKVELSQIEKIMRKQINEKLMESGVTIIDPKNTYIHKDVQIGADTIIYPGCIIEGSTKIGKGCMLINNSRIVDCEIGDFVTIQSSTLLKSTVGDHTTVGPYAYIRPESTIGKHVKIGDFVEVKKSVIGDNTKISHLTYVGDGEVGSNVNLGCGVVFVNYDGKNKHKTIVEDDVFVGCNVNLVAPVTVKSGAYIAAGSTITDEVPEKNLAIARCRQTNKPNYFK